MGDGKPVGADPEVFACPAEAEMPVEVKALWNSQIRWLLNGPSCKLKKFFYSTFSS